MLHDLHFVVLANYWGMHRQRVLLFICITSKYFLLSLATLVGRHYIEDVVNP
jgi:hypothetical protein